VIKKRKSSSNIISLPKRLPSGEDIEHLVSDYPAEGSVLPNGASSMAMVDGNPDSDLYGDAAYQSYEPAHEGAYPEPPDDGDYGPPASSPLQASYPSRSIEETNGDAAIDPSLEALSRVTPPHPVSRLDVSASVQSRPPPPAPVAALITNGASHTPPKPASTKPAHLSPSPSFHTNGALNPPTSTSRPRSNTSRGPSLAKSASPDRTRRPPSQAKSARGSFGSASRRDSFASGGAVGTSDAAGQRQHSLDYPPEDQASLKLVKELMGSEFGLRNRRSQ
jgi:hypothetical protein